MGVSILIPLMCSVHFLFSLKPNEIRLIYLHLQKYKRCCVMRDVFPNFVTSDALVYFDDLKCDLRRHIGINPFKCDVWERDLCVVLN